MSKSFEIITKVGLSNKSITDAVNNIVFETNKERKVAWFEVIEQRGRVVSDDQLEYQVTVKLGLKCE